MKDEARIGERMSEHTDLLNLHIDSITDLYDDDGVLDFPRLLYAKLAMKLTDRQVEVWHNHFTETVTVVISGDEVTILVPPILSRHMLLPLTNQLVEDITDLL